MTLQVPGLLLLNIRPAWLINHEFCRGTVFEIYNNYYLKYQVLAWLIDQEFYHRTVFEIYNGYYFKYQFYLDLNTLI